MVSGLVDGVQETGPRRPANASGTACKSYGFVAHKSGLGITAVELARRSGRVRGNRSLSSLPVSDDTSKANADEDEAGEGNAFAFLRWPI